jgi:hypothetical protein
LWYVENYLPVIQLCPASKTAGKCGSRTLKFLKCINYVVHNVDVTGITCQGKRMVKYLNKIYCRVNRGEGALCPGTRGD